MKLRFIMSVSYAAHSLPLGPALAAVAA
jgi:hypothetical protein